MGSLPPCRVGLSGIHENNRVFLVLYFIFVRINPLIHPIPFSSVHSHPSYLFSLSHKFFSYLSPCSHPSIILCFVLLRYFYFHSPTSPSFFLFLPSLVTTHSSPLYFKPCLYLLHCSKPFFHLTFRVSTLFSFPLIQLYVLSLHFLLFPVIFQ